MDLQDLYSDLLVEYSKDPAFRGTIADANLTGSLVNPLCGDQISISGKLTEGKIEELKFSGQGCAISQASAAILCSLVKNMPAENARQLIDKFSQMIVKSELTVEAKNLLGDAAILKGVSKLPARHRCALLAWENLKKALG